MIIKNIFLKYKTYFIVVLVLITLLSISSIKKGKASNNPIIADAKEIEKEPEKTELETCSVDIKGAVKNPGVYKVTNNANVADVIELAGGLKNNATTDNINLSKKVSDEMVIYIYTKSEYNKQKNNTTMTVSKASEQCIANSKNADISGCIAKEASIITNNSNSSSESNNEDKEISGEIQNSLVNINTASKEQLMTITGIGESKAECIISYRNDVGLFNTIDDIKNVSGIGDALFDKIKDKITV